MSVDFKVGIFLIGGIFLMLLLSTQVRDVSLFSDDGYEIRLKVHNVMGLEANSKVNANGLDIGYIKDMQLDHNMVLIKLYIFEQFKIPDDSVVKIKTKGMLSSLLVSIELGKSSNYLKDGDYLNNIQRYKDVNEAANKVYQAAEDFTNLISRIDNFMGDDAKDGFVKSIKNIEHITKTLNDFTIDQQKSINDFMIEATKMMHILKQTSKNFDGSMIKLTKQLESILKDIKKSTNKVDNVLDNITDVTNGVDNVLDNMTDVTNEVDNFVKTSKEPLQNSIKKVDTIATDVKKYLNDISKSKLEIALSSHYNLAYKDSKSIFSLMLQPNKDKMYLFDLVSANDYSYDDNTKTRHIPKQYDDSTYLISAQLGNRYNNLLLRAGLIENHGGAGIDYFLFNDKLRTSLEIFDFDAKNYYIKDPNPNLRATIRYTFWNYLDAYLSYNNSLNPTASSAILGLGFRYFDNDFKTVIGVLGSNGL